MLAVAPSCWEQAHVPLWWGRCSKMASECVTYRCEFMIRKENGPSNVDALVTRHTPTLASCNGISCLTLGFYGGKYTLLWASMHPLNESRIHYLTEPVQGRLLQKHTPPESTKCTNFSFASCSASQSLQTTVVLRALRAAVLHFVAIMQSRSSAVLVMQITSLGVTSIYH